MQISLKNDLENPSQIKHYVGMSMNQMRHLEIDKIIEGKSIVSLLDFGCSEGLLLQKLARSEKMELLVGVDIQESALSYCCLNTYPQNIQQTIQFSREIDQNIYIYQGDVTKKNKHLKDINVELITLVQIIQHLQMEQLPQAVENVFGYLRPKYCFVSTPNKEFNDFFDFQQNQMRHWDHKFQWNRAEFLTFCQQIQLKYGYSFITDGVGEHISDGSKGHCTQYALFTRGEKQTIELTEDDDELVQKAHYCNKSWRNSKDKIMRGLLFKSLYYREEISFQQAIQFLQKQPMGNCLERIGEIVGKELIMKYLQQNEGDFTWNDHKYQIKEKKYESQGQQQIGYSQQIHSNFQYSFSKSSYDLSISESYQKNKPLQVTQRQND